MTRAGAQLEALARQVADALPAGTVEEVVLTGSVSRGSADELSDIEMLVVTADALDLGTCFSHSAAAGLTELDTWGGQGTPTSRVFGYREGVPIELVWQPRAVVEASVDAVFDGGPEAIADALVNGRALRTGGALARWQERLGEYPDGLVVVRVERAASTWGGYAPAGMLTIARPGERLALTERIVDDATRVVAIVYAINRVWQPTTKRLASRTAGLAVKPAGLADRIGGVLTEDHPLRALATMTELQREVVALAPDGPNVVRARRWLTAVAAELAAAPERHPDLFA